MIDWKDPRIMTYWRVLGKPDSNGANVLARGELPLACRHESVLKGQITRLTNWLMQEYPDYCEIEVWTDPEQRKYLPEVWRHFGRKPVIASH